jgi:N-acetylneuraminic acid mutarotase
MKTEITGHKLKTMTSEQAQRLSSGRKRVLFVLLMLAMLAGTNADWAPLLSARAQSGGIWTTKANMPTGRSGLAAAGVGGKLYAVGGATSGTTFTNKLEVYDPLTDSWTTGADMPIAQYGAAAATINGQLYVIGGAFGGGKGLWAYDPLANAWTAKTEMPSVHAYLAVAVIDNQLYAVGGWDGVGNVPHWVNKLEVYDPLTDTWTPKKDMPVSSGNLAAAAIDGKLYVVGGFNGTVLDTLQVYDPSTDSWVIKTSMPTARSSLTGAAIDGKLYAIGGGGGYTKVEVYDPLTDSWTTGADMPTAREEFAAAAINGQLYAVGGWGPFTGLRLNTLDVYSPGSVCQSITISPAAGTLPAGTVGTNYSQQFTQVGGIGAINWGVNPPIPGLAIDSNGLLSGAPTTVGTYDFTVTATDANNCSGSTNYTLIAKADQTITFAPLANKTLGDAPFTVNATASSGLAVSFSASGLCTISGDTVTIIGAGSCTITATQDGDANYNAAPSVPQSFTIAKAPATLTLSNLSQIYNGSPRSVTVTSDPANLSGVIVTYNGSTTAPTNAGSYAVVASLNNANYQAANATGTLVIAKASQTITFGNLQNKTFGEAPFAVSATASSGLPVSFSASGTCTVAGSTVTITGAGTCTITAAQTGDSNYNAATAVQRSFTIAKVNQTITFAALPNKTFGDAPFTVSATASSNLPVSFSATGTCTVAGNTVTITGAGTCTITASQSGNANYNAATSVQRSFTIRPANQTITFAALPNKTFGDAPFAVNATASSGLAVIFTASGSCTVSGNTVTITASGTCTITASQAGNANYNAATPVPQTFTIMPVSNCPRISLTPTSLGSGTVGVSYLVSFYVSGGTPEYTVRVSGLPAGLTPSGSRRFEPDRPIMSISGTPSQAGIFTVQVTITDSTGCGVTNTYTLNIAKGTPTITWANPDNILYPTPLSSTQLNATVNVAGTLTYSPAAGTVLPLGTHTLTVNFTPTDLANWNAASKTVTIRVVDSLNACPTISLSLPRLPDGTLGVSYYARVDVRGGSGPYTIRVSGVPAGMAARINTSYVEFIGTPTLAGNFTVRMDVVDRNNCTNAGLNLLPLTIVSVMATPIITWNPADIACNTPLGVSQLNARANVPGTFVYTPAAGTILQAGSQTLTVNFTPNDTSNWNSTSRTVSISVGLPFFTLNPATTIFANNGSYRTFTIAEMVAGITDGCTILNTSVVVIDRVTSDEADDVSGTAGITINDIVIAADCKSVQLRQEYDRRQDGRVYRIRLRIPSLNRYAEYRVEVPASNGAVAGREMLVKVGNCGS